jgi:signal transduction histidine kinase
MNGAEDSLTARSPRRLRLPRRTVRLRLTLLYGCVFLISGAMMLAITYVLVGQPDRGPYAVKITPKGPIVTGPHGAVLSGSALDIALPATSGHPPGAQATPGDSAAQGALLRKRAPPGASPPLTVNQAEEQASKLEALARQQHSEEMHRLLIDLGIALAIMATVSMGLGWFLAGRALSPLQTITKAARAISASNLHRRLALRGPTDELRELGDTFDELLERLERSFDAQRQFVANASHELRTPLTLERAIMEVTLADPDASQETLRATCERVLAIGEQQERMIDALLALARSERSLDRHEPFDLGTIAHEVIATRQSEIADRGLQLESVLEDAPTSGDPSLVERLVANLIDNAVRHNTAGGWVSVSTRLGDGRAVLTVSNTGPIVPEGEFERLFRPFQRLGAARTSHSQGHGLGLSIVAAIAAAHSASVRAHPRAGGGLDIEVTFAPVVNPKTGLNMTGSNGRWVNNSALEGATPLGRPAGTPTS